MPVTKAVIPAAGLGTRFLPATKAIPKELLPVVDKPALEYIVEEAARAGLDDQLRLDGPLEGLGERLIHDLLVRDEQRGVFLALIHAAEADGIGAQLRLSHEELFVAPLAARLEGDDAELRARLAAALVGGLFYSRWLVGDERLLAADRDELARRYGALLQTLITPADETA